MRRIDGWCLAALASLTACGATAQTGEVTLETLREEVEVQSAEIEVLQAELAELEGKLQSTQAQLTLAGSRLEAAAEMLEAESPSTGDAPGVHLGGYGEMHYGNIDDDETLDMHRFVLFAGYRFSDTLSFYSELELEHVLSGDGQPGEVELEQAFLRWQLRDHHHLDLGVFLVPVGLLNETHEPPAFYGVERNIVERNVIPATWWEGGVMAGGELAPGWRYDVAVHSGLQLDVTNASASRRSSIRGARQGVAEANARSLAYTGRVQYAGMPGLQVGVTLQYQSDLTQDDAAGIGIDAVDALLFESDIAFAHGPFGVRALYARWTIDERINLLNPGADRQEGWYVEPSWRASDRLGVYGRWSRQDLAAARAAGAVTRVAEFGLNFWPHPQVVIKADVQRQDGNGAANVDGFNLGVGYQF